MKTTLLLKKTRHITLCIGMPILWRFSFLGDSGNRGLHFFIPRGSGNLEPIPQGPRGIFEELDPLNEQANLSKMLT